MKYENKMLLVLCFISAYVWIDRNCLSFLATWITQELGMTNTQLGLIFTMFSIMWALSGYLGSYWSDRKPIKKKILMFSVLGFACLSFLTGIVQSFIMLLLVRMLLGLFEGPTFPIGQSVIFAESTETRRGINMGLMQTTFPNIFANFLGPIVLVAIALAVGWRTTFMFTFIPGIILVFFIWKVIREPKTFGETAQTQPVAMKEKVSIFEVLKVRNIKLSIVTSVLVIGAFVCYFSFAPLYYSTVMMLDPTTMSLVMSAFGIGGIIWGFTVTGLSDRFGRKPIALLFIIVGLLSVVGIITIGHTSAIVTAVLCFFLSSTAGCMPIFMAVIPSESVGPKIATTAIGTCNAVGEILGGILAGVLVGMWADKIGLIAVFYFMIACYIGTIIILGFIKETAPRKLKKQIPEEQIQSA